MKRLILAICLCLMSSPALAWMGAVGVGASGGSAGKSCAVDSTSWIDNLPSQDSYYTCGQNASYPYCGQGFLDPGETKVVCSVKYDVRSVVDGGGAAAIEWVARIYEMNGTALGGDPTGTCVSDHQHITSAGAVEFTGLSCSLVNGTSYVALLARSDGLYDESNYITMYFGTSDTISGHSGTWTSAGIIADNNAGWDLSIEILGYTP